MVILWNVCVLFTVLVSSFFWFHGSSVRGPNHACQFGEVHSCLAYKFQKEPATWEVGSEISWWISCRRVLWNAEISYRFKAVLKRGLVSAAGHVDINRKGTGCCIHAIDNACDPWFDWSLLDEAEADWQGMGKIRWPWKMGYWVGCLIWWFWLYYPVIWGL